MSEPHSTRDQGRAGVLLVSADPALEEVVARLAAAAGATVTTAPGAVEAARHWSTAGLVLVGDDAAPALAAARPARRDAVHLLGLHRLGDDAFRLAVAVGAETVVSLPTSESWLLEVLTDACDGHPGRARTLGVVGGSGGVGATTVAAALAATAARTAPALLVDTDPWGPGADRVLGLDRVEGVRWSALGSTTGRLSGVALRQAVPRRDGVGVLTWAAGPADLPPAYVVREVVSAAQRGHGTVVVDLPRQPHPSVDDLLARCDHLLVVAGAGVPAVASAGRVAARLRGCGAPVHLVARTVRAGDDEQRVARVLGLRLLGVVPEVRGLAEAVDLGEGPVPRRRGAMARAARDVLAALGDLDDREARRPA